MISAFLYKPGTRRFGTVCGGLATAYVAAVLEDHYQWTEMDNFNSFLPELMIREDMVQNYEQHVKNLR